MALINVPPLTRLHDLIDHLCMHCSSYELQSPYGALRACSSVHLFLLLMQEQHWFSVTPVGLHSAMVLADLKGTDR